MKREIKFEARAANWHAGCEGYTVTLKFAAQHPFLSKVCAKSFVVKLLDDGEKKDREAEVFLERESSTDQVVAYQFFSPRTLPPNADIEAVYDAVVELLKQDCNELGRFEFILNLAFPERNKLLDMVLKHEKTIEERSSRTEKMFEQIIGIVPPGEAFQDTFNYASHRVNNLRSIGQMVDMLQNAIERIKQLEGEIERLKKPRGKKWVRR